MTMTKDEAVDIAHTAKHQTMEELLLNYAKFHNMVEVTPENHHIYDPQFEENFKIDGVETIVDHQCKLMRGLHGAIGLCTESSEILDAYKKLMFGKQRPIREENIKEECGDVFWYLYLVMDAYGITFKDIIAHNVEKLANRYIEKFDGH